MAVDDDSQLWEEVDREFALTGGDDDDDDKYELDLLPSSKHAKLSLLLQNELASPDLLPWRLFDELKERIARTRAELFEHPEDDNEHNPLERAILEMDLKRWEFELVQLHRARVQKVAKYASHLLLQEEDSTMSLVERSFAQDYQNMREQYMAQTVLQLLPQQCRDLEEQDMGGALGLLSALRPKPDLGQYVMLRMPPQQPLGAKDEEDGENKVFIGGGESRKRVLPGSCWACPYEDVKRYVVDGSVHLL